VTFLFMGLAIYYLVATAIYAHDNHFLRTDTLL
jgi:hypothetical protein